MSYNPHWAATDIIAAMNSRLTRLGSGYMQIYTGTQPTSPDAALSGNTLLVTLTFSATAFPTATASGGVITATANTITSGTAVASGTASFVRFFKSDDSTAVFDGSVGATGGSFDMTIPSTTIATGEVISCTSCAFSETQ